MPQFNYFKIVPKVQIEDKDVLSLVYTPGVGACCQAIAKNSEASKIYTNTINSVAVVAFDYAESLKRAIFLKSVLHALSNSSSLVSLATSAIPL